MSENPIAISTLNDFIFCPVSIYFHMLEAEEERIVLQDSYQLNGTEAHKASDSAAYSTKRSMLQGVGVYCSKYDLSGKIDTFDVTEGVLTERKKHISHIYDGYIFQLYGQYFALKEMGFNITSLRFYSMDDNKTYNVALPEDDDAMFKRFEKLLNDMKSFDFSGFKQNNSLKCAKCIYEPLCSFSALKGD